MMDSSEDSVDKAIVAKVVGGDVDAYADLMALARRRAGNLHKSLSEPQWFQFKI